MVAAILAALTASSCCLGPLVLAALGLGGAGVVAGLAAYRPVMLGVTVAFLGVGFFLSYRRPRIPAGEECGCQRPKAGKMPRLLLWVAAGATLLVASAPPILERLSALGPNTQAPAPGSVATASILVAAVDCQACAAPMRRALVGVAGFHGLELDVPTRTVIVTYVPGPGRPGVYLNAIEDLGYEARWSGLASRREELQ